MLKLRGMKKYLYLIAIAVLIGVGVYAGFLIFSPKSPARTSIDSESIVSMLKREGFLVTETYIVNEQVKITSGTGNVFRDFFLGQDIVAFGTMKVSSGVDLQKLTLNDINVESTRVIVDLPPVEVKSVELLGDLTVQNRQGILKRIFDNNDGYNTAYQALKSQALDTANTSTIKVEAENSTKAEVERLIKFAAPGRNIVINFR
jgi:hypothetical protein